MGGPCAGRSGRLLSWVLARRMKSTPLQAMPTPRGHWDRGGPQRGRGTCSCLTGVTSPGILGPGSPLSDGQELEELARGPQLPGEGRGCGSFCLSLGFWEKPSWDICAVLGIGWRPEAQNRLLHIGITSCPVASSPFPLAWGIIFSLWLKTGSVCTDLRGRQVCGRRARLPRPISCSHPSADQPPSDIPQCLSQLRSARGCQGLPVHHSEDREGWGAGGAHGIPRHPGAFPGCRTFSGWHVGMEMGQWMRKSGEGPTFPKPSITYK